MVIKDSYFRHRWTWIWVLTQPLFNYMALLLLNSCCISNLSLFTGCVDITAFLTSLSSPLDIRKVVFSAFLKMGRTSWLCDVLGPTDWGWRPGVSLLGGRMNCWCWLSTQLFADVASVEEWVDVGVQAEPLHGGQFPWGVIWTHSGLCMNENFCWAKPLEFGGHAGYQCWTNNFLRIFFSELEITTNGICGGGEKGITMS